MRYCCESGNYCQVEAFRADPVLCQNSALLKNHVCNLMHRKVLVSFYQHLMAEAPMRVCVSGRAARSNNGCLTNSRNCTWYVMMDPKITPSGQTIVKPTALGPGANTDTKLLIYGLFQKGRVLAQDEEWF